MRAPALLLVCLVAAALAAPALAPYPPDQLDLAHRREAPSSAHRFGTDDLGRDVLARVLYGARVSLAVGVLSAAVAGASGIAIGGIAGFAGGATDAVLMRATDAMLAVPRLPLLMIAASVLQPTVPLLVVLIGLAGWMETARVVRAEFGRFARAVSSRAHGGRRWPGTPACPAPAAERRAGGGGVADARGRARNPAGVGTQLLRRRRSAAAGELGQHALPGAGDVVDRAMARRGTWPLHPADDGVGEPDGRSACARDGGR
jgi:hypothetical protein